jgi:hypothetical protein
VDIDISREYKRVESVGGQYEVGEDGAIMAITENTGQGKSLVLANRNHLG